MQPVRRGHKPPKGTTREQERRFRGDPPLESRHDPPPEERREDRQRIPRAASPVHASPRGSASHLPPRTSSLARGAHSPERSNYAIASGTSTARHGSGPAEAPGAAYGAPAHGGIQVAISRDGARQQLIETTSRSAKPAGLSTLGRAFVDIGLGKYANCEDFMLDNREIMNEPEHHFLEQAVNDISSKRLGSAQRCVQQALILRQCGERRTKWRDFFDEMRDKDGDTMADFIDDFKETFTTLSRTAEGSRRQPVSAGQSASTTKPLPIPSAKETPQRHQSASASALTQDLDQMYISTPPQTSRIDRHIGLAGIPEAPGPGHGSINPAFQSPGSIPKGNGKNSALGRHDPFNGSNVRRPDTLNSLYSIRPSSFFIMGRVLSVSWSENAGMASTTGSFWSQRETQGPSGQRVFTKFRIMVVMRRRHGHCLAVPVNTYRGQGVMKRGLVQSDIDAHAIIHMKDRHATALSGEPRLIKKPIEVEPAGPDQKLDPASRINFGKAHTIEYNTSVMNMGHVVNKSLPFLDRYYTEEMTQ